MFTNINIVGENKRFQYIVEYIKTDQFSESPYCEVGNDIRLSSIICPYKKEGNIWKNYERINGEYLIDQKYQKARINVFLPRFSVDVYYPGIHYALDLSTWINGKSVILGTFIFNRLDTCAPSRIRKFSNEEYYEKVTFDIVDPYDLIYSDNWKDFRENVCKEKYIEGRTINNTGAIIHCTLYPVKKVDNQYIKIERFDGGQNSINISDKDSDYLKLELNTNINQPLLNEEPSFICDLKFNNIYEGELEEYFLETYNLKLNNIEFELVIGSEDDIYAVLKKDSLGSVCAFPKKEIEVFFKNRIGWKEGIYVVASAIIYEDEEEIMHILSNKIPLTESLFGYFIQDDLNIHHVDLNSLNMNSYNLTIPNKIQKNIVQFSGHSNTKNNIIQPHFFRVSNLSNLIIHPDVTENICINLDSYKSLVDRFILKIEGCIFQEIGRTSAGIMFKVKGSILPRKKMEGVYYVLNQDSVLITSGKYIYEE